MSAIVRRLARIATAAIIAKYRLRSGRGLLFLIAAIFDPYLYALTVYFVLATVFKLDSVERFHILLIGFMAFRWGMSSLLASANLIGILRRMVEHSTTPLAAAVVAVTAPPAFVFFLAVTSAFVFSLLMDLPQQSLDAAGWLFFVVAIQAVWTVALILILAFLRERRVLSSDMPVVAAASLLWILSPVMYTFRDIPEGASKLLTSYNPVSHLLAAYQNAYWYGQNISLEVLPVLTAVGVGLIWVLGRFAFEGVRAVPRLNTASAPAGGVHLVYVAGGRGPAPPAPPSGGHPCVYTPWRARFTDLKGRDMVRLLVANWDGTRAERRRSIEQIAEVSATGRLFDDFLAIYPDQALDQLAFAVAIQSPRPTVVLDGLFDTLPTSFLATAWQQVRQAADRGRAMTVICYRRPSVPETLEGTFEVQATGMDTQHGDIGPALPHALDLAERAESRGDAIEPVAATGDPQVPLPFTSVLVTGGSSQIGRCVLRRLAVAGVSAFAVGRNIPPGLPADRFIRGDLTEKSLAFPDRLDAVVHIAGLWYLPGHIDALYDSGVRRIVCFSTTSIFVKQHSSDAGERDLVVRMVNAEASVTARCAELGIACTILRPTLVYGLGIDRNISRAAAFIRRFRFYPLAGEATGLRQPVHADDLAAAALAVLNAPAAAGKCYEVGGGERLVYREMIGRLFDVMGMPRRFVPIPFLGLFAALAGFVLRRPEVTGEMVQRMRRDLVCDNGPAIRDFGYDPRPFLSAGSADLPNLGDAPLTP
ncbi:MAG: NAD-dependent epimerase/dehydratase family protein [Alphaproteobacteria bacterium]